MKQLYCKDAETLEAAVCCAINSSMDKTWLKSSEVLHLA